MTKKITPEEKLKKIELYKIAVKEASKEMFERELANFKGQIGGWVLKIMAFVFVLALFKLFFFCVEKGWIKLEDLIPKL